MRPVLPARTSLLREQLCSKTDSVRESTSRTGVSVLFSRDHCHCSDGMRCDAFLRQFCVRLRWLLTPFGQSSRSAGTREREKKGVWNLIFVVHVYVRMKERRMPRASAILCFGRTAETACVKKKKARGEECAVTYA